MAIKKISANLLGSNAVLAANIAGGAISAADIADNSITAAKLSASTSPTFGALNVNGLLDINTSGAHLKFTRSSFDTLQFGTGTGNSISGLHLTNTTDSTVPFSIHENAPDGSLTLSDGGALSVGGETAAQSLSLYGNNHTYMGWYPTAGAGRKAYAGFGTANSSTFSIYNEAGGGDIALLAGGAIHLNVDGNVLLDSGTSSDIKFMNAGTETLRYSNSATGPQFFSPVSDKDIIFKGNDGGSTITALTLDMSEGGDAYFNRRVSIGGALTNASANADDIVIGSYNDATERGITFASTTGGGIRWNDTSDGGVIQYSHSSDQMYYSSTSNHRFVATTADAAGLVRINTSDAGNGVLHIKAADVTEDGNGSISISSPNSAMRIGGTNGRSWIQSHASQPLYLNKLGNNVILNGDGAGNVGIGTTNVSAKLHVAGTIKGTDLIAHDSGGLAFQTDEGTKRISILDSGNVVIGDNSLIGSKPTGSALNIFGDGVTLRFDGGSNSTKTILFRGTSSGNPGEIYADGGLRFRTEDAGMPITFHTNSTGTNNLRMTIDGTGGVTFNTGSITINNSSTYQIRSATSGSVLRGAAVHHLITHDHRTPTYASMTHGHMGFGFTSYALNNSSPWADIIYLNSYTDSSGGSPNAIVVSRSASNCKVVRYDWSNTSSTAISNGTQYALAGSTSSDQRLKENVQNITNGLDIIKALRPVTFNWTDEFLQAGLSKNESEIEADENGTLIAPETKVENVGLIAQEVEEVLPTIIHENEISFGGTDYKTIHYDKLVPHLIAAIKELEARVAELEG